MNKRKRFLLKILTVTFAIVVVVLVVDYTAYILDNKWFATLKQDLPVGTPLREVRAYLEAEGKQHGIYDLREYREQGRHWFTFRNHNNSIITRTIKDGFDWWLSFGNVALHLDENEKVKDIYIFM